MLPSRDKISILLHKTQVHLHGHTINRININSRFSFITNVCLGAGLSFVRNKIYPLNLKGSRQKKAYHGNLLQKRYGVVILRSMLPKKVML